MIDGSDLYKFEFTPNGECAKTDIKRRILLGGKNDGGRIPPPPGDVRPSLVYGLLAARRGRAAPVLTLSNVVVFAEASPEKSLNPKKDLRLR